MKIQKIIDRKHHRLKSQKTGEEYSFSSVISNELETKELFISQEIIPPGARSSAAHFHEETDEVIYILKGNVTAHEGASQVELSEGDVICFEVNSKKAHYLKNSNQEDAHILVIRKNLNQSDVIFSL